MSRGAWLGKGVIVGCLALIGWIVLAAPVHADDRTISDTTLEQFNAGAFYHTGLTREDNGEVQLLVAGIAGEWITDTNSTGLPALQRHTAVSHGDHILVIGGRNASPAGVRTVYYTTIDPLTHDLEDWQPTTALPSATYPNGLYWHASVVVHDRVYVLGGTYDDTHNYDHVLFAPINENGTLGAWTPTTSLPVKLRILQAAVINDRIYVVGGRDEGKVHRNEVYYATPNAENGTISGWTQTTADFPAPEMPDGTAGVYGHMVAVHEDKLYVMGGFPLPPETPLGNPEVSPYVHFATPTVTGDITATRWVTTTDMNNNLYGGAGISLNGVLFTTGGAINNLDIPSDYVGTAFIDTDGAIGSWLNTSLIAPARYWHATVASHDGWLYVIHGSSDGANPLASINRGTISGDGDQYAPDGTFASATMDLKASNKLKRLAWNANLPDPAQMEVNLYYRTTIVPGAWPNEWEGPFSSQAVAGPMTTTITLSGNARYFQYKAEFGTEDTTTTPSLNTVQLTYEVPAYLISLVKGSQPGPGSIVKPGDVITYSLTYLNPTEGLTATNAYILDLVPENTTYVAGSITGTGAIDTDPTNLRWDVGAINPGDEGVVGFAVRVNENLTQTTVIQNEAQILSDSGPARKSNLVEHTVEPFVYSLDLTKSALPASGSTVAPGDMITYTIDYTNTGDASLLDCTLTDRFTPEGEYTIRSADPPVGALPAAWTLGTLGSGNAGQTQLTIQLADVAWPKDWVITNQAILESNNIPAQTSNVVTHVVSMPGQQYPDLVIEDIQWTPAIPKIGAPVQAHVKIANHGEVDVDTPFYVELYIKPAPSAPPTGPSDHDQGYCVGDCSDPREDFVEAMATLPVSQDPNDGFWVTFSGSQGQLVFPTVGDYTIYAQIDVAFSGDDFHALWGVHAESNESNNIRAEALHVGPPRIYLPFINRNFH